MIWEQGPPVDPPRRLVRQGAEALDEILPVAVVAEAGPPLDPPHHYVVLARLGRGGRRGRRGGRSGAWASGHLRRPPVSRKSY